MRGPDEKEFSDLVAGRSHALRRTAYLMCGDWHQAEDLVQMTFIKLCRAWNKVNRDDSLDAYLRKTLLRVCIDEKRRGWWRREWPTAAPPDVADRPAFPPGDRDLLVSGLRRISAGQRAVLVLRFWEDLSVEETARVLGCSTGTSTGRSSGNPPTSRRPPIRLRPGLDVRRAAVPLDDGRTRRGRRRTNEQNDVATPQPMYTFTGNTPSGTNVTATVGVDVMQPGSGSGWMAELRKHGTGGCDQGQLKYSQDTMSSLPHGIGDDAFIENWFGQGSETIFVRFGDGILRLDVTTPDHKMPVSTQADKDWFAGLATKAAARHGANG